MTKYVTTCFTIICFSIYSSFGQSKEIKLLLDTTIAIMKSNAVNRDKVNWEKIENNIYSEAVNKNAYQLGTIFRTLFQSLNDFHGYFQCGDSIYRWHRPEPKDLDSLINEWKKGVRIQTRILEDNIGYLRVPSMSFAERNELDKKAQTLNDSLCSLLDKNVHGIVLDLRLDNGGAMYPMILGLEQILHNGKLGSFESKNATNWILKDNGFYLDTLLLNEIIPKCKITDKNIPVAILIGKGTGSSGEFLTIAFKKRKNTIFIGTNTAGYITTTQGFQINDASFLLLSTGYGRDRTGQTYKASIKPDNYNNALDNFNDISNDKKVLEAIKWLRSRN
ncbi:MAG TPA: S41 family peptidase [Puia sp.]|nr:S41 family peptidase [Puia sp.]